MPPSERGEGLVKLIVFLAVLAALVFTGVKAVPVYFNNSEFANYIQDRAVRATVERPQPGSIQTEVVHYAQQLGLPVTADNVEVTSDTATGLVKIRVDYTVPVDLKVYTWKLHFTPYAESRAF